MWYHGGHGELGMMMEARVHSMIHVWLDFLRYVIGRDGARGVKEGFRGT